MFRSLRKLKIIELLGEGLNAHVYKVEKLESNLNEYKVFALKVLKRKEDLGHFKTESENLLKATGNHLVKFRGWERHWFRPALLLEYIDGVTLQNLVQQNTLTDGEAKWVYQEVVMGLKELKASNLFHGDLSPRNIMVSTSGEIKLIDFGLTNWRTQKLELTPRFAAESVLKGESPCYESDLVSLNQIFKAFDLEKNSGELVNKPKSLAVKVQLMKNASLFLTEELETDSEKIPFRLLSFSKKALFTLGLFSFITPVTAKNYVNIEHSVLIRSSKWISVKAPDSKSWCYTPCKVTFTQTGIQNLEWRTKNKKGRLKIYVDSSLKTQKVDLSRL